MEIKKIKWFLSMLFLVSLIVFSFSALAHWPGQLPRWTSSPDGNNPSGHSWLSEQGFNLAERDTAFLAQLPLFKKYKKTLLEGANEPDVYENNMYTFSGHFYDPDTEKNWMGSSSNTALTNFLSHTENAISAFKNKNREEGFKEMAYALHYLEDACVPHHAGNAIAFVTWHTEFEAYAQKVQPQHHITSNLYSYAEKDFKNILRSCGRYVKSLLPRVEETVDESYANQEVETRCYSGSNAQGKPNCDEWDEVIRLSFKEGASRVAQYLVLMASNIR